MTKIKMKAVSNVSAALGLAVVLISFALKCAGIINVDIWDAVIAGGFCKAVFLPVDASIWITNLFNARHGGV